MPFDRLWACTAWVMAQVKVHLESEISLKRKGERQEQGEGLRIDHPAPPSSFLPLLLLQPYVLLQFTF